MYKRLLPSLLPLLLSQSGIAHGYDNNKHTGYYSVVGGMTFLKIKYSSNDKPYETFLNHNHRKISGPVVAAGLGWKNQKANNYTVGMHFGFGYMNARKKTTYQPNNQSFNNLEMYYRYFAEFAATLGYQFSKYVNPHVVFGGVVSNWRARLTSDVHTSSSSTKYIGGLLLGIGSTMPITDQFFLGWEYKFLVLQEKTAKFGRLMVKARPHGHDFRVRFVFKA